MTFHTHVYMHEAFHEGRRGFHDMRPNYRSWYEPELLFMVWARIIVHDVSPNYCSWCDIGLDARNVTFSTSSVVSVLSDLVDRILWGPYHVCCIEYVQSRILLILPEFRRSGEGSKLIGIIAWCFLSQWRIAALSWCFRGPAWDRLLDSPSEAT